MSILTKHVALLTSTEIQMHLCAREQETILKTHERIGVTQLLHTHKAAVISCHCEDLTLATISTHPGGSAALGR